MGREMLMVIRLVDLLPCDVLHVHGMKIEKRCKTGRGTSNVRDERDGLPPGTVLTWITTTRGTQPASPVYK